MSATRPPVSPRVRTRSPWQLPTSRAIWPLHITAIWSTHPSCAVRWRWAAVSSARLRTPRHWFTPSCASALITPSIEAAVVEAMKEIIGAYSIVVMSPRKLIAARDPRGMRPLCMGKREDGAVIFASESCALDALGAEFVRDIEPGEVVVVDKGEVRSLHCGIREKSAACVFEYIYFARPDSVIDGRFGRRSSPGGRTLSVRGAPGRGPMSSSVSRTPVSLLQSAMPSIRAFPTAWV